MKILKKLMSKFLLYKIYLFIESIFFYVKDYNLISETLYSPQFKKVIMKYLKCELDKDWLGRLYGVINPNIDINGNLDVTSMIVELDDYNTNNEEQVKNWIYTQMMLISELFKIEKLYSYISLDLKHVGPINHDNYLIIFDITSRKYMASAFKKMLWHILFYCILGFIAFLIFV